MISGKEYYVGAAAAPLHDLVDQLLLCRTPIPRRSPVPSIDDVTDEVQRLREVMPQKVEQRARLACTGAQVDVGYPDSPVIPVVIHGLPLLPALTRVNSNERFHHQRPTIRLSDIRCRCFYVLYGIRSRLRQLDK